MPSFGNTSRERLDTCHPDIIMVMEEAIIHVDFSVVWGQRGKKNQNMAYEKGHSTKQYPDSKHNKTPSQAIDILPYPTGWPQKSDPPHVKEAKVGHFYYMAGVVMKCASDLGIKLRWGGDWDQDNNFINNKFDDLAHFERAAQ